MEDYQDNKQKKSWSNPTLKKFVKKDFIRSGPILSKQVPPAEALFYKPS